MKPVLESSTGMAGIDVVILWSRYGPYHAARLKRAQEVIGSQAGWNVRGLEIASRDHYEWAPHRFGGSVEPATLFPGEDYGQVHRGKLREAVRQYLDCNEPGVVAVNGWSSPEARESLRWVARARHRRAIVMSETKADDQPRTFIKEWIKRRILAGAQAALVGGDAQAEYLGSLGIPSNRIFLGYDAVDNHYFQQGSDAARSGTCNVVKDDAGRTVSSPYFLACSRFIERKNIDGLLRAYARYRDRSNGASWPLAIAGSGEKEHHLRRLAGELGIASHVHWLGFVQYPDLPGVYAGAGAFVHPAKSEPWGLVVNEAAACAIPLLISGTVGAARELVDDGTDGYTFSPFDDESLVRVLLNVTALDDEERAAMGQAARSRVSDFGPDRFARGLLAAVTAAREATR
jgi:1,2-diacylglycerol 3-alpha-glucosyltransferase